MVEIEDHLIHDLVDYFFPPDTYDNWPVEIRHDDYRSQLISKWQHPIQAEVVRAVATVSPGMKKRELEELTHRLADIARNRIRRDHHDYRVKEAKAHILKAKIVGEDKYVREMCDRVGGWRENPMTSLVHHYFRGNFASPSTATMTTATFSTKLWSDELMKTYKEFHWYTNIK